MNLISTIAQHIAQGLTAAESAARLRAEHALEVGEDWVRKIMGADGFGHAVEEARASVASAQQSIATEAAKVEAVATDAKADVEGIVGAMQEAVEGDIAGAEAKALGEVPQVGTGAAQTQEPPAPPASVEAKE